MKDRRSKGTVSEDKKRGRPPKFDKKVEEDLIAENQRLRMEIDYLKKLSALVLAEERKNGKIKLSGIARSTYYLSKKMLINMQI